jgi:hypothetical protein
VKYPRVAQRDAHLVGPARPNHHIVGQRAKQRQHALSLKALLIALGEKELLLVAFQGGFDTP